MRIFGIGRRKEIPSGGEPIRKLEPGKVPEKKLWDMAMVSLVPKAQLLAKRYPDLRGQVIEEEKIAMLTVNEIGTRLTTFVDKPETLEADGKKEEAVEAARQFEKRINAVKALITLEGEGAENVRREFALVLWCHPDDGVREEVVNLVNGLKDKDVRLQLLQRMEYDSNEAVQEAVHKLLQYKETGKEVA